MHVSYQVLKSFVTDLDDKMCISSSRTYGRSYGRKVLLIGTICAAVIGPQETLVSAEPFDGNGCVATSAFNATAWGGHPASTGAAHKGAGTSVDNLEASGDYTCDKGICWESHPGYNIGDTAWMLFATTFVMLQTPVAEPPHSLSLPRHS